MKPYTLLCLVSNASIFNFEILLIDGISLAKSLLSHNYRTRTFPGMKFIQEIGVLSQFHLWFFPPENNDKIFQKVLKRLIFGSFWALWQKWEFSLKYSSVRFLHFPDHDLCKKKKKNSNEQILSKHISNVCMDVPADKLGPT